MSTEISEGALFIKAADIEIDSQTLPVMIPPAAHMGKLEIWDVNGRLVYSRRSLPEILRNAVRGFSKSIPVKFQATNGFSSPLTN